MANSASSVTTVSTGTSTSGLATIGNAVSGGIDVTTAVTNEMAVLNQPLTLLQNQQTKLNSQVSVLSQVASDLSVLQNAAADLKSPFGSLNAKNVSSTDTGVVTALAGSGAQVGSHTIVVDNLATTSSAYSTELPPSTTTFTAGGTLSLQVGSQSPISVTVDGTNNTLQGLATAINNKSGGVTASVITDTLGSRLSLVSNASGAAGNIVVTGNTTSLGLSTPIAGVDALIHADGVPVTSASNNVTNAIPGVALNLQGSNTGTTVTLSVTADSSKATTGINTFVSAYNTVMADINAQNAQGALLSGDATLRGLQQQVLSDISTSLTGNGAAVNLESIGVQLQNDGSLQVNSGTLTSSLNSNFNAVQNLFQNSAGVASTFYTDLYNQTDPTAGSLGLTIKGNNNTLASIGDSISALQSQLADKQTNLETYYNRVNVTLEQMPLLLQQVNAQFQNLP